MGGREFLVSEVARGVGNGAIDGAQEGRFGDMREGYLPGYEDERSCGIGCTAFDLEVGLDAFVAL